MFKINEYKIVFKRIWHERATDINGAYVYGNGRYDTICEIYVQNKAKATNRLSRLVYFEEPNFTGVARLHPNDTPDKIVGKKIALRNAIGYVTLFCDKSPSYNCADFYDKKVRTAIWKAFWGWIASWSPGSGYLYCERGCKTNNPNLWEKTC